MAKKRVTKKAAARPSRTAEPPFMAPGWPDMPKLTRLDAITPYSHNSRTHPPAQIAMLATLLKRWGPDQPIVVDEKGEILKGHGRRLAAIEAGFEEFPVVVRLGLHDDEKRAMRIADNQVALLAGWDQDMIRFEVESLKRSGYEMALLGFGEAQLVEFTTQPGPPAAFAQYGENIDTKYCCPSCGYRWSGQPDPERGGDASEQMSAAGKKRAGAAK